MQDSVNEVEPTGRCGKIYRLQLSSQMHFISYFTATKIIWILSYLYCLEDLMRSENINLCKNGKNVQLFISMMINLPEAPAYKGIIDALLYGMLNVWCKFVFFVEKRRFIRYA